MSDNAGGSDVSRCRARIAELLEKTVATTRKLEENMAVDGDWSEAAVEIDFDADPPLPEQKTWSFRQSDKVASLEGGHEWYAYHTWRGRS